VNCNCNFDNYPFPDAMKKFHRCDMTQEELDELTTELERETLGWSYFDEVNFNL
jgi:hypothetical protein